MKNFTKKSLKFIFSFFALCWWFSQVGLALQNVPGSSNLIYEETFENGEAWKGDSYAHQQFAEEHAFAIVNNPVYMGQYSGKFELRYGDRRATSTGIRSEVLFPEQNHRERWYSFSVFFPADGYQRDNDTELISQWHQHNLGSPSVSFNIKNDRLILMVGNVPNVGASERDNIDLGSVPKDSWQEFVFHVIHSNGGDGLIEIWQNGEKILNRSGGNIYPGVLPRWKIGIYKWTWDNRATDVNRRILYFDNVRIGNEHATLEDMRSLQLPLVPVLESPENTINEVPQNPLLKWKASANADHYRVQVSTSPNFNSPIVNQGNIEDTQFQLNGLEEGTNYFWRVRPSNKAGNGAWSETWGFSTKNSLHPPPPPVLVEPGDKSDGLPTSLTFKWDPVETAESYRLQIATNRNFNQYLLNRVGLTATEFTFDGLEEGIEYFWRVQPSNEAGNGTRSEIWTFTTKEGEEVRAPPPPAPTLLEPGDNGSGLPTSLTFKWEPAETAESYSLQISTSRNFNQYVLNRPDITATEFHFDGLEEGNEYFWRVIPTNEAGNGERSEIRSFVTEKQQETQPTPPPAPKLLAPENNATELPTSLTFEWETVETAGAYQLQVSTSRNFNNYVLNRGDITAIEFGFEGLEEGTEYFWRVRPSNEAGNGTRSEIWAFTTEKQPEDQVVPPPAPALLGPEDNGKELSTSLTFKWEPVETAESYSLQISTSRNFNQYVLNREGITETEFTFDGLEEGKEYFWRVRPSNEAGNGARSETWTFTTERPEENQVVPPPAPALLEPGDNGNGLPTSLTFKWEPAETAESYSLQISTSRNFNQYLLNRAGITATEFTFDGLEEGVEYFWRVRPDNEAGNGARSEVRSFTTEQEMETEAPIETPPAPKLLTPENNATELPTSVTFEWETVETADAYQLQVSTSREFNQYVLNRGDVTATEFSFDGLEEGKEYFWRVQPANEAGNGTTFETWAFSTKGPEKVQVVPPSAPALLTPENNGNGLSTSLTFRWQPVEAAGSYTLQISTNREFNQYVLNRAGITANEFTFDGLEEGIEYFWRIRPANEAGNGPWSVVWSFVTEKQQEAQPIPPPAPKLLAPENNATELPISVTFEWETVETADVYQLQVSTGRNFNSYVLNRGNISNTQFTFDGMEEGTQYFWRVRPANEAGNGTRSEIRSFTTEQEMETEAPIETPPAPKLLTPENNATELPISVTFEWETVETADVYQLQVSTSRNFNQYVLNRGDVTATEFTFDGLEEGVEYFWRVRPSNEAGNGERSEIRSFVTEKQQEAQPTPPPAPKLLAPENNATELPTSLTFEWETVETAGAYQLQVSTSRNFNNYVLNRGDITAIEFGFDGLEEGTEYFWRVQPSNGAGDGTRSEIWAFTTEKQPEDQVVPPPAPALLEPGDNGNGLPTSLTFKWEPVETAESYRLQISTNRAFNQYVFNRGAITATEFTFDGLEEGIEYFWRVRPSNEAGNGTRSEIWAFTTKEPGEVQVPPPPAPVLLEPADKSQGLPTSLTFKWQPAETAGSYRLQISTSREFNQYVFNRGAITATEFTFDGLEEGVEYFWRVRPSNGTGNGAMSETWAFSTKEPLSVPAAPDLVKPVNGSGGIYNSVVLEWKLVENFNSYRLQVSDSRDFSSRIVDVGGLKENQYVLDSLLENKEYFWRVGTWDDEGQGEYSSVWSFTTVAGPAPEAPQLVNPDDGALISESEEVTLMWEKATDATEYEVRVSIDPTFTENLVEYKHLKDNFLIIKESLPDSTYYWQITAVNDRSSSLSETREFRIFSPESKNDEPGISVKMYPNPARDHVYIDFSEQLTGSVQIIVNDNQGRIVMQQSIEEDDDVLESIYLLLPGNLMPQGAYYVHVKSGNFRKTLRLIKK